MAWQFHPKMTAGAFAGAATVILVAECKRRGYDIDAVEGSSITVLLSGLAGWAMPSDDAPPPPAGPPRIPVRVAGQP